MLPHYPLYIGRQSPSPHSQFSAPPTPRRSSSHQIYLCCLIFPSFIIALLLTVGSSQLHVVSGGGKVLASSRDSRGYKNLNNVEMALQMVCLCQRFDRHSPTLNTPQPDCLCLGLSCSLSTVQQHAHHFWLVFVCTISPLIPNPILTRLSISVRESENCALSYIH